MARLGHRLRPRLGFAAGDRAVIGRIAVAGIAGLVLQQLSLLVINWSAQQTGDQGALTRFTWANAIYLLPYAVLVAPLLQVAFPRLATAAEEGASSVAEVLDEVGPQVIMLASLGAALLVATAVPVARVFVLGPGSGDTAALAWLIVMLAPAVVGFGVLGLCSRTLLAQHRARAAGGVTMTAWAVVILAALGSRVVIPVSWQVVALAASVSLGLCVGGVVGAVLARSAAEPANVRSWWGRSTLICLPAAGVAGGLVAWPAMQLRDAGLLAATAGCDRRRRPVHDDLRWSRLPRRPKPGRCAVESCPPSQRGGGSIMKIAQVLTASTGGIGRHVASVVVRLVQRGHAVRIYAPAETSRTQRLDDLGADVLPLSRLGRLAGADVVHAHGYKAGAIALGASSFRRVPLVVTWHNAVLGQGWSAVGWPAVAKAPGPRRRSDAGCQHRPGGRGASAGCP